MAKTTAAEVSERDILARLAAMLEERKKADADSSYVAGLFARGDEAILQKIGEEATETIVAGAGGDRARIVHETADLWFHTLILLAHKDIEPDAVLAELARRFGVSGLTEKAGRGERGPASPEGDNHG